MHICLVDWCVDHFVYLKKGNINFAFQKSKNPLLATYLYCITKHFFQGILLSNIFGLRLFFYPLHKIDSMHVACSAAGSLFQPKIVKLLCENFHIERELRCEFVCDIAEDVNSV